MPAEEKIKYADAIIYNADDLNQLEARITKLWHELQQDSGSERN
jgi:dephospho-CoA kinase